MAPAQMATRTVYQAGYAKRSLNNWRSCATGSTPDEARKNLAKTIQIKALQWVANFYKTNPEESVAPFLLESLYKDGEDFATDGEYTEQSYEEAVRE